MVEMLYFWTSPFILDFPLLFDDIVCEVAECLLC